MHSSVSLPLVGGTVKVLGLVMGVLDGHHDVSKDVAGVGSAVAKLLRAPGRRGPPGRAGAAHDHARAVPAVLVAPRPGASGLPCLPCDEAPPATSVATGSPVVVLEAWTRWRCSRSTWPPAGRTKVEVAFPGAAGTVGRFLPAALGRLEGTDAATARLVGSTDNPGWYAEQLAAVPVDGGGTAMRRWTP